MKFLFLALALSKIPKYSGHTVPHLSVQEIWLPWHSNYEVLVVPKLFVPGVPRDQAVTVHCTEQTRPTTGLETVLTGVRLPPPPPLSVIPEGNLSPPGTFLPHQVFKARLIPTSQHPSRPFLHV